MLLANGKAQLYVHDLNLFVTVQLFEDTIAVLSLGKLCEDHGFSCEWVSDQKKRLTNLLSFQGYPPVLEATRRQHRHRRIGLQRVQLKNEVTN